MELHIYIINNVYNVAFLLKNILFYFEFYPKKSTNKTKYYFSRKQWFVIQLKIVFLYWVHLVHMHPSLSILSQYTLFRTIAARNAQTLPVI